MGHEDEIRILRPVTGGLISRTRARVSNFAHGGITPEEFKDNFIGAPPMPVFEPKEMEGTGAAARSVIVFAREHPENKHPFLEQLRGMGH